MNIHQLGAHHMSTNFVKNLIIKQGLNRIRITILKQCTTYESLKIIHLFKNTSTIVGDKPC